MNEAFSDIIGESVDILNRDTPGTAEARTPFACTKQNKGTDTSKRWLMGEESLIGAIRDMYTPECFYNPGSRRDILYSIYACYHVSDSYGVHSNSGVFNKIFTAMSDGNAFPLYDDSKRFFLGGVKYTKKLHFVKALNIMYWTYFYMHSTTDFVYAGLLLNEICELLYYQGWYDYYLFVNKRHVDESAPMTRHMHCKRLRQIIRAAYLLDGPVDSEECANVCTQYGICSEF